LPGSINVIYGHTFYNCINLENVILNEGTIYIMDYAFSQCPSLKSIKIPKTLGHLDKNSFDHDFIIDSDFGSFYRNKKGFYQNIYHPTLESKWAGWVWDANIAMYYKYRHDTLLRSKFFHSQEHLENYFSEDRFRCRSGCIDRETIQKIIKKKNK
jgi:hypothetical protein